MLYSEHMVLTKLTPEQIRTRSQRYPDATYSNIIYQQGICFTVRGERLKISCRYTRLGARRCVIFRGRMGLNRDGTILHGSFFQK